jgi:hypothetical protein
MASLVRLIADRAANPLRHSKKICVFLGAGADIGSGGLSFADLKRQSIEEFSNRVVFDVTTADAIDKKFNSMFVTLQPDERALLVEAIFRRMQPLVPSDAYKLLVLLAEAGGIDAIITTNFDSMLERAQELLGRDLFQVYAPGLARPYLLSDGRFDLPKKPYLKLHGDIAARSVVLLTSDDLDLPAYESSMIELLTSIVQTHDIVFAGYGGNDPALADIITRAVETTTNRIFWCSPGPPSLESVLYSQLQHRVRLVDARFDDLMMEVARPVLERPSLMATEPTYLRCLFEWRVDYCNREYIHAYGERSGRSMVDVFVRRHAMEEQIRSFLLSSRPLAIVAGPSGYGKTTLGIRLHKVWHAHRSTRIFLIRSRALPDSADIEQHIADHLGGLGTRGPFSLFRFERWLSENGIRLVLFVDGINEFSAELVRCVQLFRNILRFCYFLPERDSALRVIVTIRQETWSSMLSHLDSGQLRQTVWNEGDGEQSVSAIPCGELTEDERDEALARYRDQGYASIDISGFTPSASNQLRDPYLLAIIADVVHEGLPPGPSTEVYQRAFESKLQKRGSFVDVATLKDIVGSVAIKCLRSQQDRFRELDIMPAHMRGEVIRLMKDLHVFVDAGDGFLQFDHDRTLEYFIALGLGSGSGPSLETVDDLLRYIRGFRTQSKPIAAARLFFELAPKERFSVIEISLGLLDTQDSRYDATDRELLFGFAREVLVGMTEQGISLARQYLEDAIEAAISGRVGSHQLRAAVQCAASLPLESAIPLLARAARTDSALAATEANIYATDKLVKRYLTDGCPAIDLFQTEYYAAFFSDRSLEPWQRLGRVLGFAAQIGPDNAHPDEYANVHSTLNRAFDRILREPPWEVADARVIADRLMRDCDRLLFNSSQEAILQFFSDSQRSVLVNLIGGMANGRALCSADLMMMRPYIRSTTTEVQYHVCHVIFVLSSFNNLDTTLQLLESELRAVTDSTSPYEIDFLQAAVVYMHVIHNLHYDDERFAWLEERILNEWANVLLFRPGMIRGERRGFVDLFDRVFEDGFGVIYPYGYLSPSRRRRLLRYEQYHKALASERISQLPLYTRRLDEFLRAERVEEALQILQALAGVIVVWPREGLAALRATIGYPEPRIRRAVIRILAEAFNRHPNETMSFLKTSGAAISDEDLIEIKIRHDGRIGRRQINEVEWGRVAHFLLSLQGGRENLIKALHLLLKADSVLDAVLGVLQVLGLVGATAR